jgi:voltage-gated potassium channel
MIIGYGILAVPTGIFAAELSQAGRSRGKECLHCGNHHNEPDALYCKQCGERLDM